MISSGFAGDRFEATQEGLPPFDEAQLERREWESVPSRVMLGYAVPAEVLDDHSRLFADWLEPYV